MSYEERYAKVLTAQVKSLERALLNAQVDKLPLADISRAFDAYKKALLATCTPKKLRFKTIAQARRALLTAEDRCNRFKTPEPNLAEIKDAAARGVQAPLLSEGLKVWTRGHFAKKNYHATLHVLARMIGAEKVQRIQRFNAARQHTRIPLSDVINPPLLMKDQVHE